MYDAFGNSVSYAEFDDARATSLRIVSEIGILHYEAAQPTGRLLANVCPHQTSGHESERNI